MQARFGTRVSLAEPIPEYRGARLLLRNSSVATMANVVCLYGARDAIALRNRMLTMPGFNCTFQFHKLDDIRYTATVRMQRCCIPDIGRGGQRRLTN